jgi:hypothetical protein
LDKICVFCAEDVNFNITHRIDDIETGCLFWVSVLHVWGGDDPPPPLMFFFFFILFLFSYIYGPLGVKWFDGYMCQSDGDKGSSDLKLNKIRVVVESLSSSKSSEKGIGLFFSEVFFQPLFNITSCHWPLITPLLLHYLES